MGKKPKLDGKIRCWWCGKFIGYKEFERNEIRADFIPNTEFTVESCEYAHKKCIKDGNT